MTDIGIRDISVSFHDNKISNISLVQGDALTRGFDITFVNAKGETLPVDDDYVVELVAVNSKVKDTPYACRHEVVDNKYRVMIPPEALSDSGSVTIQLVFYQKSTKAVIHTIKQKCPVYQSIGQEFIESNNLYVDITALRLGLEKIEKLDGKYEEIIDKDIEIQANEIDRKEAEKKRNLDEEIRKDNEAIRNSNEEKREQLKTALIELKNRTESDLESINLTVDDIVSSEDDRKQNEIIREEIKVELENLVIDIQNKLNDGDFVGEKGDQGIQGEEGPQGPPGEVTLEEFDNLSQEVTAHKEDYAQQRQLPHFNHAAQEYINLDKFWNNLRDGKIYTTEFNQFSVSPSPNGTKLDDNADLIMESSTNTVAGRDDYSKIGLFKPIEVNAYVDENDDYHVIAIQGDGRFKRDGSMGDVYIMNMVGYTKYYSDDEKWSISYSDTAYGGFSVIQEAIKPDGTIRPYLLHAKYVAGRNSHENNNLASITGVPAEYVNMSHNGQITEFKAKGTQYSGKTSHDDFWVQLLMWIKYATMNSDSIMRGCQSYYLQYTNLEAEADVKRVIITSSQANNLLIGSAVSIGDYGTDSINTDRQAAQNYNLANRVNITAIEDLEDGNSAIYVDSSNTFDTTLTTTITTYPWNSGGCDNVLGVDGSPYSTTSGKEPFIIGGIEMMIGGYEVLQNLIILNNAVDNRIDVYVNYDCRTYATSVTSAYALAGELVQTNNAWKYGSKISIPKNHPSIILTTEAEASSTTGTGDGIYTNPPSAGGTRVWPSLGGLSNGAISGLRCLRALLSLADTNWYILGRLSATGRSQRRS